MKINWKVRFKNKVWLVTFLSAIIAFIYQILSMFEIVPAISQENIIKVLMIIINLLVGLGVLIDPTTKGFKDSTRAMRYTEPN